MELSDTVNDLACLVIDNWESPRLHEAKGSFYEVLMGMYWSQTF